MTGLRAIVVGSGWGGHSARALAREPGVELRAIVGRGSERTRQLASSLGVGIAPTLTGALREHRPDIVVLAVDEHQHRSLAIDALTQGAHILCAHPVASSVADVCGIAEAARHFGRIARTDYTFRLRPELRALAERGERGALLRIAIDAPGRWLPIVLDLAVFVAGPVARVVTVSSVPPALVVRAARTPAAFPPSILLEHANGVVSSFVPFPHASPRAPVEVRTSWERARVHASLPRGGATLLAIRAGGVLERRLLVESHDELAGPTAIAAAMEAVASEFVRAVRGEPDLLADLDHEAHLRAVWSTVWRSSRSDVAVAVEPPPVGTGPPRPSNDGSG